MSTPALPRRLALLALFVAALLGAGLALATGAFAHASITSSDPADGARLAQAPTQVSITFDQPVTLGDLGYLHVTDAGGHRVDTGPAFHPGGDDAKIAARLRSGLGDGSYTESFRIISADSHPVAGSVAFVVGHGTLPAAASGGAAGPATDVATAALFTVARWASYAGFALLGGLWLLLTVWPSGRGVRRARALVWGGWGLTVLGALAELWLQGPYVAGDGLADLGRASLLDDTLHTPYGQYHSARLLLLGLLAALLGSLLRPRPPAPRRSLRDAAWPLLVGVGLTFSLIGHPDTTSPRWLSVGADLIHLCAMAAWVGGLAMLLGVLLPRREAQELRVTLPAVSRVAFTSVVALVVTGTYAAWRGIGSWGAILGTDYGLLVCAKVLGLSGLIALGDLSRRVVQRRLARPRLPIAYAMSDTVAAADADTPAPSPQPLHPAEHERMRRSVLVELVLAGLVLAATAVLVNQPRGPEVLAARDRQPVSAQAPITAHRAATITVEPGVHGPVGVSVDLGPGPQPSSVTATALQPARQLGPIPVPLRQDAPDHYSATGVDLPASGGWVITLVVTTSAFDAVTTQATIHLH